MLTDDEVKKYLNVFYAEAAIQNIEIQLLDILKLRQENCPSEKNDAEWLSFSDWTIKRKKEALDSGQSTRS